MVYVIKSDNRKEDFDREKVRRGIERAAERIKELNKDKAKEIADRIAKDVEESFRDKDEVKSSDIRDTVLDRLEARDKRIAQEFRNFRK